MLASHELDPPTIAVFILRCEQIGIWVNYFDNIVVLGHTAVASEARAFGFSHNRHRFKAGPHFIEDCGWWSVSSVGFFSICGVRMKAFCQIPPVVPINYKRAKILDPRETKGNDYEATTDSAGPCCDPDADCC